MKLTWTNNKWSKVILHVIAWIIIFSLSYLLASHYNERRPKNPDSTGFFYLNTVTGLFWVGLFYLNAFALIPRFIYKRRYALYVIILVAIFSAIMAIHSLLFLFFIKSVQFIFLNSLQFNLPTFILTVAVSTTYRFITDRAKTDKFNQQKHEENLKTELSFLRSQISPHFIFNVLNNMVALVRIKSDQLEPTIMKLSSLLQYMLYETDEEKVLLKNEVEYLQSYIDLQQQRFGSKVKLNLSIDIKDDWYTIEPMMLIPFVENAFKHGVGLIQNPQIDIELSASPYQVRPGNGLGTDLHHHPYEGNIGMKRSDGQMDTPADIKMDGRIDFFQGDGELVFDCFFGNFQNFSRFPVFKTPFFHQFKSQAATGRERIHHLLNPFQHFCGNHHLLRVSVLNEDIAGIFVDVTGGFSFLFL